MHNRHRTDFKNQPMPRHNSIVINQPSKVSFEGFSNLNVVKKLFTTTTNKIPQSLSKFTFETISKLSEKQHASYSKITNEFVQTVQTDWKFRQKLGLSLDWGKKISLNNLPDMPTPGPVTQFLKTLVSPITWVFDFYKPLVRTKLGKQLFPKLNAKLALDAKHDKLFAQYKGFIGLTKSIKIWENGYRQFSGNGYWVDNKEFLIPEDVLINKIRRRRPKAFDPEKGKYSTKSLMLGNRLISGMIYAVFLSTDAFNTTFKFSKDKSEAVKQQKSRFSQENARIGLNLYLQNIIFSTFEQQMNKSLFNALFASGATVAMSEIVGRQLVSKPIMPSNKATLDRLDDEMLNKEGVLPAIGRLMTRVKKPQEHCPHHTQPSMTAQLKPQIKSFGEFGSLTKSKNTTTFTGMAKVAQTFDSKVLGKMLKIVEDFDPKQYEYYKETIEKGFKLAGVQASNLDEAMVKFNRLPVGENATTQAKVLDSVFTPVKWVKGMFKSIGKSFKTPALKRQELADFVNKNGLKEEFKEFLNQRLELPVWQKSQLNHTEKQAKILEEFVGGKQKIKEEIQGVKNVLLWLDKQIKANKIDLNHLSEKEKKAIHESLEKSIISNDGAKHLEYDGNTLSQLNIHTARLITTIFLVTDAYNLTMQYSNDNKKEAIKSAKDRTIQEATRISLSAYMLGFTHNLLSKFCNSSLLGAFTTTAVTSLTNDTLTRVLVGKPLTPQTKVDEKK